MDEHPEDHKDLELKELERQKALVKARAELAAEQRKQLEAERGLADLLDPEKGATRSRLSELETKQKELEAVKKLFPGSELTVSDAVVTLADGAYIDNEIDGAGVAQALADLAADEIRAYEPGLSKILVLDPATAELFVAYRNVDAQLGLAEQTLRKVEQEAKQAFADPKLLAALGIETVGISLALLSTIGKSAASIAQLFKISREVKNPVALSQFTREFELALYGNLVAGHAPGAKPKTPTPGAAAPPPPQKIVVVLPAILTMGQAPALATSRILRKRTGARAARDAAEQSLKELEEKALKPPESGAVNDQQKKSQERLQARARELRADFERAASLLAHVEDLLFGKSDAPDARPVLDGLLAIDQIYEQVQNATVPLLFVEGLAAGARNEVRKSLWRSPKWSRSAGGVVGVALYKNDGTLLWARLFSRQSSHPSQ